MGVLIAAVCVVSGGLGACAASRSPPRPPFTFSQDESAVLDEVQRGAFRTLWEQISPETSLALDRSSSSIVSVAGVGMQLSAMPIGVERGWISREQGRERTLEILESLREESGNRKRGMFYHFLDGPNATPSDEEFESNVSSADCAILFAGVLVASSYFGGEIARIGDELFADADWTLFVDPDAPPPHAGTISLAWTPDDLDDPSGSGTLQPFHWLDAMGEQRLIALLANCAPIEEHRLEPRYYWGLRRQLGVDRRGDALAFSPFTGALFTFLLSHLWIDYAHMPADDPARLGYEFRASIDWWENSRRAYRMQRDRAMENPYDLHGLNKHAWGFTASDTPRGYLVFGLMPDPLPPVGGEPERDFTTLIAVQAWGDGTISPHAPVSSILFEPRWALASIAYLRGLEGEDGPPMVWRDPDTGGQGFLDAYNLGQWGREPWVAPDYLALNQGMLLLAVENARTGLIWRLFHRHRFVRAALERLRMPPPEWPPPGLP